MFRSKSFDFVFFSEFHPHYHSNTCNGNHLTSDWAHFLSAALWKGRTHSSSFICFIANPTELLKTRCIIKFILLLYTIYIPVLLDISIEYRLMTLCTLLSEQWHLKKCWFTDSPSHGHWITPPLAFLLPPKINVKWFIPMHFVAGEWA